MHGRMTREQRKELDTMDAIQRQCWEAMLCPQDVEDVIPKTKSRSFLRLKVSSPRLRTLFPRLRRSFLRLRVLFPRLRTLFPRLRTSFPRLRTSFPRPRTSRAVCQMRAWS